jgi:hypothetical protein
MAVAGGGDLGVLTPGSVPPALSAGITQTTVATPGATLTTATPANVASKSLAPGTYLIWGIVDFALTAATSTEYRVGLSLTSATLAGQAGGGGLGPDPTSIFPFAPAITTDIVNDIAGPTIVTLAATTTVFLVAQATFSAGGITAFGTLNAMLV